jgi:hypothetical protein
MRCFDVAVWRWWPSLFPAWCEVIEARNAFAAVEAVMRWHGCMTAQHAAACATDGLLIYRCFGVRLTPGWQAAAGWSSIPGSLRQGVPRQGEQAMPRESTLDAGG